MLATFQSTRFPTHHQDYVNDIKFDFYGRRIATCSADMTIKVWDLDENGDWNFEPGCEWKAHHGMVWKLDWAHPEFGQVLASCSSESTVQIWEEQVGAPMENTGGERQPGSRWHPKAQLNDSHKWVQDVKFAPRHQGLKLATASADGKVRIYEAIDVMNLSHWPLREEFQDTESGELGFTCLSWNRCQFECPMIATGTDSGTVKIWCYDVTSKIWCMKLELEAHASSVLDIDWAPNIGRSFHLLATAGKDRELRVYRFPRSENGDFIEPAQRSENSNCVEPVKMEKLQELSQNEVWRVQWNVTGTVLASSGDDGQVRLWRSDYQGCWRCTSEIQGDLSTSDL